MSRQFVKFDVAEQQSQPVRRRVGASSRLTSRPLLRERLSEVIREFTISDEQQIELVDLFVKSFSLGLEHPVSGRNKDAPEATCFMLPSYVTDPPTGKEEGLFIALDLGGTNFRVMAVILKDGDILSNDSRLYKVPQRYRDNKDAASVDNFFKYLADKIASFLLNSDDVREYCELHYKGVAGSDEPEDMIPFLTCSIGFTFSFACEQTSLKRGLVTAMGKGFNITGINNRDVVELIQKAIAEKDVLTKPGTAPNKIVKALCNDAVGTLVSCSYEYPDTKIGLICGTGLNASYEEFTENMVSLDASTKAAHQKMLVNTEMGVFGSYEDHPEKDWLIEEEIFTSIDEEINDDEKIGKSKFLVLEKMCSGQILGEIVRRILRSLSAPGGDQVSVIFKNADRDEDLKEHLNALRTKRRLLPTKFLSDIEALDTSDVVDLQEIVDQYLNLPAAQIDCDIIHKVCTIVSTRAAILVGCAVCGIAKKIWANYENKPGMNITCGVDGSLYTKHPTFSKILKATTQKLLSSEGTGLQGLSVEFVRSHDGSGKGAAMMAAGAQ